MPGSAFCYHTPQFKDATKGLEMVINGSALREIVCLSSVACPYAPRRQGRHSAVLDVQVMSHWHSSTLRTIPSLSLSEITKMDGNPSWLR